MSQDEAVRSTNDDAASCKRSAVQLGYWTDPYLQYFVRATERKPPEINRGYYARVAAIRYLIHQFIKVNQRQCQVVNLGAGFDTQYWNLCDEVLTPSVWVDVDFDAITGAKIHYIKGRRQLSERLTSPVYTRTDLHSTGYHILGADLRSADDLMSKLRTECGIDCAQPTAFIAECVLVYMPAVDSTKLVRTIADTFNAAFFVSYEQVNMKDRFGQVMIENLQQRGCSLAGVEHCTSLDTQRARFLSTGWSSSDAMNMLDVYKSLPQTDVQRVERLEMLDDYDSLAQLFEHYCVTWACKDKSTPPSSSLLQALSLRLSPLTDQT